MKKNKDKNINEEEKIEETKEEVKTPEEETMPEQNEVELLGNRIKALEESLLRSQAELINYKRRREEEVDRMLKYSKEDLIKELLPIVDNFERAINMDDDNLDDEVSKFLEGFKMVYAQIKKLFEKYEVKEIESLGKEFDPTYHQAVMTDHIEGKDENIIIDVLQKGYTYKDRVIRPAMVKVNK